MPEQTVYERIYAAVAHIPEGRVSTYGRIAAAIGRRGQARQVGYALAALPGDRADVPWHRVVNAAGRVSPRADPGRDGLQQRLLEAEGVRFDASGRIDLSRYLWRPPPEPV
jgi:methylated-DNA-protein-cysteine methyltransferase-like protein